MSKTPTIADQVGNELLFENDRVRVWDLRLQPGQSTGLHRHKLDYFYVVIDEGTLQAVDAKGNGSAPTLFRDGTVCFRQLDQEDVHEAVNVGPTPWRNIVVELKDGPNTD